jgi:hypothetical protein
MKNIGIEIRWGLYFTAFALIWMVFEKQMGWHDENIANHSIYTNLFAIVAIAVYVFALLDKRKNFYGGVMTWKQGFVSGLIISAVVAVLSPLSQYLTHTFITPDYFENIINYSVESGKLSQELAERQFNLRTYMINSTIFAFVVGAVTSAIVALFVKKSATEA